MKILLDTHALLWWLEGDKKLPKKSRDLIQNEDNTILVSSASAWEISTKVRIGKMPNAVEVALNLPDILISQGFNSLPISILHAQKAGLLAGSHRDPFDRMLIAQSMVESIAVVTNETIFEDLGASRLWD